MNLQKEPEKFTPSDYENITSSVISNVSDPVNCFNACDNNPECDGVSLIKNKETNNFDCVLGLKNLSLYDSDNETKPIIYQKRRRNRPDIVVYDDTYPTFYPNYNQTYFPQSMTPLHYPYWWWGGRGTWRDGRFAGYTTDESRRFAIEPQRNDNITKGKGEMPSNGGMDVERGEMPGMGGMEVSRDEIGGSVSGRKGGRR